MKCGLHNQNDERPMSILFISGSPTEQSRSARLLDAARERVGKHGFATDWIQVRDLPAQALLHADFKDPVLSEAIGRVEAAQAVVVSSPVYKAAYAGVLKAFLDLLPQTGLAGKLVLPLATAGSPAHTLALDYALRPVLAALGARDVVAGVFAVDTQVQWWPDTGLHLDPNIESRLDAAVASLIEGLRRAEREALHQRHLDAPKVPFGAVRVST